MGRRENPVLELVDVEFKLIKRKSTCKSASMHRKKKEAITISRRGEEKDRRADLWVSGNICARLSTCASNPGRSDPSIVFSRAENLRRLESKLFQVSWRKSQQPILISLALPFLISSLLLQVDSAFRRYSCRCSGNLLPRNPRYRIR